MAEPSHAETFAHRVHAVASLANYARAFAPMPTSAEVASVLTPEQFEYLKSAPGQADVLTWADTLRQTIDDLVTFRQIILLKPTAVSLADLEAAEKAVDRAAEGLRNWIESSPEYQPRNHRAS